MNKGLTLSLILITIGCGGAVADEDTFDPATVAPIPELEWCEAFAREECGRNVACCNAVGFPAERTACERSLSETCRKDADANRAAGMSYDAKAAGICLAGRPLQYDGCRDRALSVWQVDAKSWQVETACGRVWTGHAPIGGACSAHTDCATPAAGQNVVCDRPDSDGAGVCRLYVQLGANALCASRPAADGSLGQCGYDLACSPVPGSGGAESRCVPLAARGERCRPFVGPVSCKGALTCDPVTETCTDLRPLGAPCVPALSRLLGDPDAACVAPYVCDSGHHVCVAPKPLGAPCDPDASGMDPSLRCGLSEYCAPDSLRCISRQPDGSVCSSDDECIGYRCSGGRCVRNGGVASLSTCSPGM